MGVDIEDFDHDKLSEALGTGDWTVALPLGYHDFVIPLAWRAKQRARIGELFVRWVLGGKRIEIEHWSDPSWDHSGSARRIPTDPEQLLMRYKKLRHWMHKEPTGNSEATYESHYGLHWFTYGEELVDDIERALYDLLQTTFPSLRGDDEDKWDEMVDIITWGFTAMAEIIKKRIGMMSTEEVWDRYEESTRLKIEIENYAAEERAAQQQVMFEQVRTFWQQQFPDLMGVRLDKIAYHEYDLENRLRDLFADAPPVLLQAFLEARIPAYTSNSVDQAIRQMALDALAES